MYPILRSVVASKWNLAFGLCFCIHLYCSCSCFGVCTVCCSLLFFSCASKSSFDNHLRFVGVFASGSAASFLALTCFRNSSLGIQSFFVALSIFLDGVVFPAFDDASSRAINICAASSILEDGR